MSIGLLLITHYEVGEALLDAAIQTLNGCPLPVRVLSVTGHPQPDLLTHQARCLTHELDSGEGVLVLTDLYGATPSNVAVRLLDSNQVPIHVVSGVNLPMLIRVLNYPQLSLAELADKARRGGCEGIVLTTTSAKEWR